MPPIRSLASERCAYIVAVIFLLGEIMPSYSYYKEKKLVYITIVALFSRQPFSYIKCTKSNIHSSCNVRSVSNAKCLYFIHPYSLQNLRLSCLICLRVLRGSIRYKT